MKFFDKLKQRHQEKLDNKRKYPVKYLYRVEAGQFTITEQKENIHFHYEGEEVLIAEELKGEELVKYLKKTYNTTLGAFLPDYHEGDFTTVRYFRIPSRDNLILPSPTVEQSFKMVNASFEGINNEKIRKLISTDFGKKNANCDMSLNEIRYYENIANNRVKKEDDNTYTINSSYNNNNFENNKTESVTCSEDSLESDYDYSEM